MVYQIACSGYPNLRVQDRLEPMFGKTKVSKSKKWMALPLLLFAFVSMSFESINVHSKTVEPWVLEGENDPFWLKIQPSIDTKTAD